MAVNRAQSPARFERIGTYRSVDPRARNGGDAQIRTDDKQHNGPHEAGDGRGARSERSHGIGRKAFPRKLPRGPALRSPSEIVTGARAAAPMRERRGPRTSRS